MPTAARSTKVEAVAIAAQTRVRSLTGALAQLALDIKAEESAQIEAERRARIDAAIALVTTWRDGATALRAKFLPLVGEAEKLSAAHDTACTGYASQMVGAGSDAMNSTLVLMDIIALDFAALLVVLNKFDVPAYDQSGRVLSATA